MPEYGYFLASEEFRPADLVESSVIGALSEAAPRRLGHGFAGLKPTVTDLDTMKINRRSASRR